MHREELLERLAEAGSVPLGALTSQEIAAGAGGRPEAGIILGVLRAPAALVFAGRESTVLALYGFREERLTGTAPGLSGFVDERVDQSGRHEFTVRTTTNAVDTLTALASRPGHATRLDAYHSRPGGTRRIQAEFLAGPAGASVLWSASGVEPEPPRRFAVTADGLRSAVRDALCEPGGDPPGGETTTREGATVAGSGGQPYQCPVCGYPELSEPPREEDLYPSYEICPSCGFEFGVTDDDRGFSYADWRREWVADGMRWWSRAHHRPRGWDPQAQLRTLP